MAEQGFTFAHVGTITLAATLGYTLPQPLFGLIVRRYGAHRLVLVAVVWCGLFYGAVGWASRFWLLLAAVALGGMGSALFHPAGSVVASAAHRRRRGASMSIFSVGGNAGAALSPLLMAAAIAWLGLRGTLVTVPLALATAAVLWLTRVRSAVPAAGGAEVRTQDRAAGRRAGGAAIAALALIVLFAMARAWYQVSLTTYLPLWIDSHAESRTAIAQVLFVLMGSVPAGSLLGGSLSDRVGRWPVMLAAFGLLVPVNAGLLAVGPAGSTAAVLALTAGIGFLLGMTYPVAIIMAQEAWPQNIGFAGALVMGLGWLPGGIGASALGVMADSAGLERALSTLVVPLLAGVAAIGGYAAIRWRRRSSSNASCASTP